MLVGVSGGVQGADFIGGEGGGEDCEFVHATVEIADWRLVRSLGDGGETPIPEFTGTENDRASGHMKLIDFVTDFDSVDVVDDRA